MIHVFESDTIADGCQIGLYCSSESPLGFWMDLLDILKKDRDEDYCCVAICRHDGIDECAGLLYESTGWIWLRHNWRRKCNTGSCDNQDTVANGSFGQWCRWVIVKGAIQVDYLSLKVSDKTIPGLPGSSLYTNVQVSGGSGILYLKEGSNNVIMRNVTFIGPGA